MSRKNERRMTRGRQFYGRNNGENFRNGGLIPPHVPMKFHPVGKKELEQMKEGKAITVSLPLGTTSGNVNFYRYIRLIAYQEISRLGDYVQCEAKDIPFETICLSVLENLEMDIGDLISTQVDSVMIDMGILKMGGANKDGK